MVVSLMERDTAPHSLFAVIASGQASPWYNLSAFAINGQASPWYNLSAFADG